MKSISKNFKTAAVGTVFGGSLLFTAGMGIAGAEPVPAPTPDGLVNVTVGGTTILDSVSVDEATNASAAICGTTAPDVNALVQQVDTQGVNQTVCAGLPGGDLVLAQNVSLETTSPVVPGTDAEGSAEGAAEGAVEEPAAASPSGSEESAEGDLTGAGAAETPSTESDTEE
ncbi:MAG: hypothetical protein ABWY45_12270 [Mycobacterium sp.]